MPQVWSSRALSEVKARPPTTGTGTRLLFCEPLPSWPYPPSPQQYGAPPIATPQECGVPAVSDANTSPADTGTGAKDPEIGPRPQLLRHRLAGDVAPNWPSLLSPQQWATPPAATPQP